MVTYITPSITIGVHSIVLPVAALELPRVVRPGRLEPRHVLAVDLIQLEYRMQPGSFPTPGQSTDRPDCPGAPPANASRQASATTAKRIESLPGRTAVDGPSVYTRRGSKARERRPAGSGPLLGEDSGSPVQISLDPL